MSVATDFIDPTPLSQNDTNVSNSDKPKRRKATNIASDIVSSLAPPVPFDINDDRDFAKFEFGQWTYSQKANSKTTKPNDHQRFLENYSSTKDEHKNLIFLSREYSGDGKRVYNIMKDWRNLFHNIKLLYNWKNEPFEGYDICLKDVNGSSIYTRAGDLRTINKVVLDRHMHKHDENINLANGLYLYESFVPSQPVKLFLDFELLFPVKYQDGSTLIAVPPKDACEIYEIQLEDIPEDQKHQGGGVFVELTDYLEFIKKRIRKIQIHAIRNIYEQYEIQIQEDWFEKLNAHGIVDGGSSFKISYHIILKKGIYWEDCEHLKHFFDRFFTNSNEFKEGKFEGVDKGVYGNMRLFRLPLCCKYSQDIRPVRIQNPNTSFDECLITYCPMDDFSYEHEGRHIVCSPRIVQCAKKAPNRSTSKRKASEIVDDSPKIADTHDDMVKDLLMSIPFELAEDYNFWIQTGIKLKRAGGTVEMWEEWTERYFEWLMETQGRESSRRDKLRSRWEGFDNTNDIHMFFSHVEKHGSAEKVIQYKMSAIEYVGLLHNEIGQAFHLRNPQHVYSHGSWWYFNGVRWKMDTEGMWISRSILSWHVEINKKIKENKDRLLGLGQIDDEEDEESNKRQRMAEEESNPEFVVLSKEQKDAIKSLKDFNKKLRQIKKITQDGQIGNNNALRAIYFNDTFYDELDNFHDLLAFNNGVIDLTQIEDPETFEIRESFGYRKCTPEDKITLSTTYDFSQYVSQSDHEFVTNLFRQIYPNDDVFRYVFRFCASMLTGRVLEEHIHFLTGMNSVQTGANGKSTLDTFLSKILGEYAIVGHPSLLTGARESANQANSALMSIRMKRLVSFQEVNDNGGGKMTLNMSIIKGLTGGDAQSARDLHEKQGRPFEPTWKIIVSANKLPPMSGDDGGARRRIRDIPHESKFVDNPDDPQYAGMENIFKKDVTIKERIKNDRGLHLAFLQILLREHVEWRRHGLTVCERVERHTLKYINEQDLYCTWIDDTFEKTDTETDTVSRACIEELFRLQKKQIAQMFGNVRRDTFLMDLCIPSRLGPMRVVGAESKRCNGWAFMKLKDHALQQQIEQTLARVR